MLHLYFEHTSMLRLIINSYYIEEYFFFFFNRISFNFLRNRIVHFTRNSNSAHTYRSHVITLFYILYLHEVSAKRVNLTRSPFHRFLMIFSSRCVNSLRPTQNQQLSSWYMHDIIFIRMEKSLPAKRIRYIENALWNEDSRHFMYSDFYEIL